MRRIETFVSIFVLMLGSGALGQQQVTTPSGEVVVDQSAQSSRWPLQANTPDAAITIFQPQMEDFSGDTLKARAAVSVQETGQQQPIFGAVWLSSRVATDRVARTVTIQDVDITQARFPNADEATQQKYSGAIKQALLSRPVTLSLDQLLAMLETVQKEQAAAEDLQNTAPKIIFRDHPAIKVQYDGPPKLVQASNSKLMRVANTPFFVGFDPGSKTYWLKGAGLWFSAADAMGPFQRAPQAPAAIAQLADADNYKDPQQPLTNSQALSVEIVTASDPSELIWTDGDPEMGTIAGTNLLYWTNTDSDVFLDIDSQQLYVLLSGRWYSGPSRNGPWTNVPSDKLPPDFSRIPPDSEQGDVLAFVAGTQAAQDAVADTEIPQTAGVDRKNYDQPQVEYDGDPSFQPVEGTPCSYAVNSGSAVVLTGGRYYCCDNAVWYTSAAAVGPWEVCTAVPPPIYTLPPSCPIYAVRYCYVYGYTPDVVYCGYLPGYVGCYRYHGCVVYGTGYYYHPWWGHRYYARPWTYGFAAHYNSYVGHWGFSFGLATGSGSLWVGSGPHEGRHGWFGFGGYRPVVVHNDVRADMFRDQWRARVHDERVEPVNRDRFVRNVYERRQDVRWEAGRIEAAQADHRAIDARDARDAGQAHQATEDRRREGNDVFTDKQGNVYRRTTDGWEVRDKGNWSPAHVDEHDVHAEQHPQPPAEKHEDHPAAPPEIHGAPTPHPQEHPVESHADDKHPAEPARDTHDLDKDYRARISGDQRLRGYEPQANQHQADEHPAEAHKPDEHQSDQHQAAPQQQHSAEQHPADNNRKGK